MERGQNSNIIKGVEEADPNPHGWLWGVQDFSGRITADVLEITRELEAQPEDITELLQDHDKTWKDKQLPVIDE